MSMNAGAAVRAQTELHLLIARSYENIKKSGPTKTTVGMLESRLKTLEKNWSKFEANHDIIHAEYWEAVKDNDYITKDCYGTVEEIFTVQRGMIIEWLQSMKANAPKADPPSQGRQMLPRIQLPTFSGKYDDWPFFRDLFLSLVSGNAAVSGVERLHYLKASVKGEAAQVIKNLPTTEENFERAWTMLSEHYENKRLLVRSCLAAFTSLPKMKTESASDLKRVFHGMLSIVGTMESIGRDISEGNDLFIHLVVEMLDQRSRREWENSISGTTAPPTYSELKIFIERRLRTLEALQPQKFETPSNSSNKGVGGAAKSVKSHLAQKTTKRGGRCSLCQGDHYVLFCSDFQKKSPAEKRELAESKQLCLNCFGKHLTAECQSKKSCAACSARHHSSTHDAYAQTREPTVTTTNSLHVQQHLVHGTTVLLATARVNVADRHGHQHQVRALIDPGSEVSLITEALVQRLRLQRTSAPVTILGIGGHRATSSKGKVIIRMSSRISTFCLPVSVLVLPRISAYSSRVHLTGSEWPHTNGLQLADPRFWAADPVEILLGTDVFSQIIEEGLRKGDTRTPIAQQTTLGWILSGVINDPDGQPGHISAPLTGS